MRYLRSAVFVLLAVLVGGAVVGNWIWRDSRAYLVAPLPVSSLPVRFSVPANSKLKSVIQTLVDTNIIDHPRYVLWEARRLGIANKIKAGDYDVTAGMTPLGLLDMLVAGRSVQYTVTFVEGMTVREILKRLEMHPQIIHTLRDGDPDTLLTAIGKNAGNPEGMFFPDTYSFRGATTDVEILRQAYNRMTQKLETAWSNREPDLPYATPYEALTMASIVEKETAADFERPQIAGVFVRRLQKGMLLQTDPTVIYALGERYSGNLHKEDLQIDNPYNTYRYKGLTPSPIAAAGEAAIVAALHPASGNALYFVSRGDGSHQFSATLDEHNSAVSKFQRGGVH